VVVFADDRLAGDDGEIGEQGLERGGPGFRTHGHGGLHIGRRAPFRPHLAARGLVQRGDVQIAHGGAVVHDLETLRAVGLREDKDLGLIDVGQLLQLGQAFSSMAMTMRSWDSLMKTCQLSRSGAFSGAFSSQTSPPVSRSISPAAELKPPAPQSVTN
jgi:hypothetical protein